MSSLDSLSEDVQVLRSVRARLPELIGDCRREGFTWGEIARVMSMSEFGVRKMWQRSVAGSQAD